MPATENGLPFPDPLTAEAKHYFAAAAAGRLELQRCNQCDTLWFFPRPACVHCGSQSAAWVAVSGRGRIESFTIVHRAPTPAFRGRVPYVLAMIVLDEGPRMMANVLGDDALSAKIGDRVEVCFEARGEGRALPQFRRVPA